MSTVRVCGEREEWKLLRVSVGGWWSGWSRSLVLEQTVADLYGEESRRNGKWNFVAIERIEWNRSMDWAAPELRTTTLRRRRIRG